MRRCKPGLIEELERVLPFLAELRRDEQKHAADALGRIIESAEERRTMTKEQCRIVREMRMEKAFRDMEASIAKLKRWSEGDWS